MRIHIYCKSDLIWKDANQISRGRSSSSRFRIGIVIWRRLLGGGIQPGSGRLFCQLREFENKIVGGEGDVTVI
jgi:hypothetical protein